MKELLKTIGMLIWILGGGMIIASIFIGLPILAVILILERGVWLLNYVPEIVIVIGIILALIWGFTEKTNNPVHW